MSNPLPVYPFDPDRCIGTVTETSPAAAKLNLPLAAAPEGQWHHGFRFSTGEVGDFVVIDCGDVAIFARIISVKLPERERLSVEPVLGQERAPHPVGVAHLLTTLVLSTGRVTGGISRYPRLGSKVYAVHPLLLKWLAEVAQLDVVHPNPIVLELASLTSESNVGVHVTPERILGRHCAVLGATGGGKSWTVARLIEQIAGRGGKVILLDATGEFHTLRCRVRHVHIGSNPDPAPGSTEVAVPYTALTEGDLFALLKPSGQTQAPKLRLAMKSLKLAKLVPELVENGTIPKAQKLKSPYDDAYRLHVSHIEGNRASFDIEYLTRQISEECVYPSGGSATRPDYTRWGSPNEAERSYCVSLITRIEDILTSDSLACIFQPKGKLGLARAMQDFLTSDQQVLRISLRHLPFDHNAREIVANAIGRRLLDQARRGEFLTCPLVVVVDEAHQFLNKTLGDESTKYPLDAFDLIAKEGRKFSLNICLATQRPRDIPEGVLSQMGTLIVHRLVNDKDREVVERASGDIDRSAAAFLPTLAPGEAVIIGADFPIPLTIQVAHPENTPDSRGPDYQNCWKQVSPSMSPARSAAHDPVVLSE